jgi:hypothetical protein
MDTSLLSLKPQQTLEMYALKANQGYLALKILDLCTSQAKEDSLGLMAQEQHCLTPLSPTNSAGHSIPLLGATNWLNGSMPKLSKNCVTYAHNH